MNVPNKFVKILLVDDEVEVTNALERSFRREPYECLMAHSAAAGMKILKQHRVQVVISDEQMPGMSGSEFLSSVRKQYPDTIRMILSGQASLEAAVRAINEGEVHRFFIKPCNPTDLLVTVRQALVQKRLEIQSRRLLREYQRQAATLARLEHHSLGVLLQNVDTDEEGAVVVDECDGEVDVKELLAQIELAMSPR